MDDLRASEEQLRATFEQAAVGIAHVAPDGRFIRVNPSLCAMVGYDQDELLNHTFQDITYPDDLGADQDYVRRMLAGQIHTYTMQKRYVRKDQTLVWANLTVSLVRGASGEPKYFIAFVEDISAHKLLEQAIAVSEEKYRAVVENAPAAIFTMTHDGQFLFVNPTAAELMKRKPEELVGQTMHDLFPTEVADRQLNNIRSVIESGVGTVVEAPSVILGEPRWFRTSIQPLTGDSEAPRSALVVAFDINESKQAVQALQASEAKFRALIEFAPDPIVLVDAAGRITLVNQRVQSVLGYQPAELIGQAIEILLPDRLHAHHVTHRARYGSDPVSHSVDDRGELVVRHKNGEEIPVKIGLSPIHTGDEQIVMAYMVDMSKQKRLEADLRTALAKEKELGELRSRFVSMVSHDIRTPLTVIRTSTDLLQAYDGSLDEARKARHFHKILTQVDRMILLLNDVLTISQTDSGGIQFAPQLLDLDALCRQIADEFQGVPTMEHTLAYTFQGEPARLLIDEKLFHQALDNLLTNAFKYSPAGGTVHLDLTVDEADAVIQVKDSGIGIPEADQAHLFEMFYRAGNVGAIDGTGLGLAIVKRSVEAHGGTVRCESHMGVGTTFTIKLPRLRQPPPDARDRGKSRP